MKTIGIQNLRQVKTAIIKREEPIRADIIFKDIMTAFWESVSCGGGHEPEPGFYGSFKNKNKKGEEYTLTLHTNVFNYTHTFETYSRYMGESNLKGICRTLKGCNMMITEEDLFYLYN